jgi:hypothetical protein
MSAMVCNSLHNDAVTGSPSYLLEQVNAIFKGNVVMDLLPERSVFSFMKRIVVSSAPVFQKQLKAAFRKIL